MNNSYKPYNPKSISEIMDYLGMMMLKSPTFVDKTGYFPERNIDTVFIGLNGGLAAVRKKLGEQRYLKLVELSHQMRACFEADPDDRTEHSIRGRNIIHEMEDLLMNKGVG